MAPRSPRGRTPASAHRHPWLPAGCRDGASPALQIRIDEPRAEVDTARRHYIVIENPVQRSRARARRACRRYNQDVSCLPVRADRAHDPPTQRPWSSSEVHVLGPSPCSGAMASGRRRSPSPAASRLATASAFCRESAHRMSRRLHNRRSKPALFPAATKRTHAGITQLPVQ